MHWGSPGGGSGLKQDEDGVCTWEHLGTQYWSPSVEGKVTAVSTKGTALCVESEPKQNKDGMHSRPAGGYLRRVRKDSMFGGSQTENSEPIRNKQGIHMSRQSGMIFQSLRRVGKAFSEGSNSPKAGETSQSLVQIRFRGEVAMKTGGWLYTWELLD